MGLVAGIHWALVIKTSINNVQALNLANCTMNNVNQAISAVEPVVPLLNKENEIPVRQLN